MSGEEECSERKMRANFLEDQFPESSITIVIIITGLEREKSYKYLCFKIIQFYTEVDKCPDWPSQPDIQTLPTSLSPCPMRGLGSRETPSSFYSQAWQWAERDRETGGDVTLDFRRHPPNPLKVWRVEATCCKLQTPRTQSWLRALERHSVFSNV